MQDPVSIMSRKLLIDAGATKTAFAVVNDGVVQYEHTGAGINPNYTPDEEISRIIGEFVHQSGTPTGIREVRYYGAGCASLENAGRVGCVLQECFPDAKINVYSDLMAVCHALSRDQRSIVGILGTGAATCLFDGVGMESRAPSLGYMLGDEGSGTNLGKRLLTAYLRGQLPPAVAADLQHEHQLSFESAIHRIYREPAPNKFWSSLAPFVLNHIDDDYVHRLALEAFMDFFSFQKNYYENAEDLPWNLSGSIAFHFEKTVREAAEQENCRIGKIVKAPMPLLIQQ